MKSIYKKAKQELITNGLDFKQDVHELSSGEIKLLEASAKKYGYKITSCGNSSLGCIVHARFYLLLQKIRAY